MLKQIQTEIEIEKVPMTDPLALAVAFSENLEAKNTNIHRKYSGYLIKIQIS